MRGASGGHNAMRLSAMRPTVFMPISIWFRTETGDAERFLENNIFLAQMSGLCIERRDAYYYVCV